MDSDVGRSVGCRKLKLSHLARRLYCMLGQAEQIIVAPREGRERHQHRLPRLWIQNVVAIGLFAGPCSCECAAPKGARLAEIAREVHSVPTRLATERGRLLGEQDCHAKGTRRTHISDRDGMCYCSRCAIATDGCRAKTLVHTEAFARQSRTASAASDN